MPSSHDDGTMGTMATTFSSVKTTTLNVMAAELYSESRRNIEETLRICNAKILLLIYATAGLITPIAESVKLSKYESMVWRQNYACMAKPHICM